MTQAKQQFAQAKRIPVILIALGLLAACEPMGQNPASTPELGVQEATRTGPAGAAEGTCWGKTISPAVIERVSTQVQVKPAKINPDGTVATPPVYRTEENQIIVVPRKDNWFETPCPEVLTPEFIASLQRALQVRGAYAGKISGEMNKPTRASIRTLQLQNGVDSSVLSLSTARALGLVAVPRDPAE